MSLTRTHDFAPPSRGDAALFELKASLFRLQRLFQDGLAGPRRLAKGDPAAFGHVIAQSHTPLWAEVAAAERTLQRGKVQNLRVAARQLDCTAMAPGAVFSFWKQLGRASAMRGFARGRMLKEGCIVPRNRRRPVPAFQRALRRGAESGSGDRRAPRPFAPRSGIAGDAGP